MNSAKKCTGAIIDHNKMAWSARYEYISFLQSPRRHCLASKQIGFEKCRKIWNAGTHNIPHPILFKCNYWSTVCRLACRLLKYWREIPKPIASTCMRLGCKYSIAFFIIMLQLRSWTQMHSAIYESLTFHEHTVNFACGNSSILVELVLSRVLNAGKWSRVAHGWLLETAATEASIQFAASAHIMLAEKRHVFANLRTHSKFLVQ